MVGAGPKSVGLPDRLATSIFTLPLAPAVSRDRDLSAIAGVSRTSSSEPSGCISTVRDCKDTSPRPSGADSSSGEPLRESTQLVRSTAEATSATMHHFSIIPPQC